MSDTKALVEEYKTKIKKYDQFQITICDLLVRLLKAQEIRFHQITGRAKDPNSLEKKIDTKTKNYEALNEITDLSAARIITYLASDIDPICKLIHSEFEIDTENSVDKRKYTGNTFGYLSVHIVAGINSARLACPEYKMFSGLKIEIQIRSILQHAWAEIEHDLGYKKEKEIPSEFRRNFSRIAALLEVGDKEFDSLKKELNLYREELPRIIEGRANSTELNTDSLLVFVMHDLDMKHAKSLIESNADCSVSRGGVIEGLKERFNYFDISTIEELRQAIDANRVEYFRFVEGFCKLIKGRYINLPKLIPAYYFLHFLAAKSRSLEKAIQYAYVTSPKLDMDEAFIKQLFAIYEASIDSNA